MKSREIFALAVRISGLICLLYTLSTLLFIGLIGWVTGLVRIVALVMFSLWLLRGAPQLVHYAYRDGE